ncbi:hypothetical protein Tco_1283180 [Tanacetum coccineum]
MGSREEVEKEERGIGILSREPNFLDTVLPKEDFLLNKDLKLSEIKPPSRKSGLEQMMTYLKHVEGKKHSDLKTKGYEEIKALYDNIKKSDDSFIAIGSAEDEKVIKEMNEQVADASKKRVKKDDSI